MIGATEWVGPYLDDVARSHAVVPRRHLAGMPAPGGGLSPGRRADGGGGLADWKRAVIEEACDEELSASHQEATADTGFHFERMATGRDGALPGFPKPVRDAFGEASSGFHEERRGGSGLVAEATDAFEAGLRGIVGCMARSGRHFFGHRDGVLDLRAVGRFRPVPARRAAEPRGVHVMFSFGGDVNAAGPSDRRRNRIAGR